MTGPGEPPARTPDMRKPASRTPDARTPDARTVDAREPDSRKPVRAAGCVLWRRRPSVEHGLEIALVHRPKYDDWSHPKGKLKRGEDALAGAVREVAEETGMDCRPGAPLPTSYYFANGRPKQVRYWAAEAMAGAFTPTDEVDRLEWLPPEEARHRLTQERDRPLIDALLAALHLA